MTTYYISDRSETITTEAASIKGALEGLSWDSITALLIRETTEDESEIEHHVLWCPGEDPRIVGPEYGPIETDWLPVWVRQ